MICSSAASPDTPILVFDLMDTVVVDPFFTELPRLFGARLAALHKTRDPTAWPAFERGELDEEGFLARLYPQGCPAEAPTPVELRDAIIGSYRFVEGMPELLGELRHEGHALWALSNYPVWIEHARAQLGLDALFDGMLASYQLQARKPEHQAYQRAAARIQGEERVVTSPAQFCSKSTSTPSKPSRVLSCRAGFIAGDMSHTGGTGGTANVLRQRERPAALRPATGGMCGDAPKPAPLLLIDDRERNCSGARDAGWQALRFEGCVELREALCGYGFLSTP